jgi:ABC-2 type transport system ATP-binding protein
VRRRIALLAAEERRTVVLCTHDLAEADALCDRVVVLERGRIVAQGSPAALAASHGTGGIHLDVDARDVATARRLLAAVAGSEVDIEGAGRLRASGVARDEVPGLVRALADADVTVFEVRRLDPSLEDVYLAIHGRDRAGTPNASRAATSPAVADGPPEGGR